MFADTPTRPYADVSPRSIGEVGHRGACGCDFAALRPVRINSAWMRRAWTPEREYSFP
jgi:hypothetical protein